eukprot:6213659-Pleurochrysis_carterae.AAC.2
MFGGRSAVQRKSEHAIPGGMDKEAHGGTHATQRSRTTGATGARKSDATTIGRHAALHARARSDGESGRDGQESAVGTPVAPTATEKAGRSLHSFPCASALYATPLISLADRLLRRRQTRHWLVRLEQARGRRAGVVGQDWAPPGLQSVNADGLQDGADNISKVS